MIPLPGYGLFALTRIPALGSSTPPVRRSSPPANPRRVSRNPPPPRPPPPPPPLQPLFAPQPDHRLPVLLSHRRGGHPDAGRTGRRRHRVGREKIHPAPPPGKNARVAVQDAHLDLHRGALAVRG